MNQIVKDFGKGFKQLGVETAEKLVEETGKIAESIITAQELLGDIKPLTEQELAQKKAEDEKKKQEEMSRLRQGYGGQAGHNVENEMEQIRHQQEKEEEEKERYYARIREQQERERQQQAENSGLMMESTNPAKQKKSRGSAFANKKKQQPDQSQMSQTSEFKGKID